MSGYRVLVCGSRTWTDANLIRARIAGLPRGCEVLHGDARGADNLAASEAMLRGLTVRAFPADWKRHGKRAGLVRNIAMLDENPDLVIAFWDGKSTGTVHTITQARARRLPVEVITEESDLP